MSLEEKPSLLRDIVTSYFSLPVWVQIWVALILMPINLASLAFLSEPMGGWIAFLAIIAMAPNGPLILYDRGFGKIMAIPHLLPWTILVIWIVFARPPADGVYNTYLTALAVINTISLVFDYRDAYLWWRERRGGT